MQPLSVPPSHQSQMHLHEKLKSSQAARFFPNPSDINTIKGKKMSSYPNRIHSFKKKNLLNSHDRILTEDSVFCWSRLVVINDFGKSIRLSYLFHLKLNKKRPSSFNKAQI